MIKTIGIFNIEVWNPYPCWCNVKVGEDEIRFSHKDLSDLEHAVKEMKKSAIQQLGDKDGAEV